MITETDRKLLAHVENYGFITIGQARDMYYSFQKFGYEICRKRMAKLVAGEYLKEFRNFDTNEKIFCDPKKPLKRVSLHTMLTMNYYAKLINAGVDMKYFKREHEWMEGKIRSDAFVMFEFGGYPFYQAVETHVSHNHLNIEKYVELYNTKEAQKICSGEFPTIVLLDDSEKERSFDFKNKDIRVIQLDFKLSEFNKVFL